MRCFLLPSFSCQPTITDWSLTKSYMRYANWPNCEILKNYLITSLSIPIIPTQKYQWLQYLPSLRGAQKWRTGALLMSPTKCCSWRQQTYTAPSQTYQQTQKSPPSRHRRQVSYTGLQSGTVHHTWRGSANRRLRRGSAPLPETGLFYTLLKRAILYTINDTYCSGI